MTIVFESQLYPQELISEFEARSKVALDYAAHNLCKALYSGFTENGQNLKVVNVPNLGSFPLLYSSPLVKGAQLQDGKSLSFWNISLLKRWDIRRRIKATLYSILKSIPANEEITLLLYNYRCLPLLSSLKDLYPDLKIVMVITDLTEYMLLPKSSMFRVGNKLININDEKRATSFNYVDGVVLLAPAMRERLPIEGKPWIQIEGIYNSDTVIERIRKEEKKTILYTGNLGLRYGIGVLLEAFHQIPGEDYQLWICGGGDGQREVQRFSSIDRRIIYKGVLPRKEVLALQAQATILVNPRNSSDDYTRYSFPSKTMEYLASGTPVVMSHLKSIPPEYNQHIYYWENETVEGLRDILMEVCLKDKDELLSFGQLASKFILEEKTPRAQTKRIIDFINSL